MESIKRVNHRITTQNSEYNDIAHLPLFRQKMINWDMTIALGYWLETAEKLVPGYQITKVNLPIIEQLIYYAMGDERFSGDLTRGVGLLGPTGTGKTKTMEILNEFIREDQISYFRFGELRPFNFKILSVNELIADFGKRGWDALDEWSVRNVLCIDDFAAEDQPAKYYGNEVDVLGKVIEERYRLRKITHLTSNIKHEAIKDKYGDRVSSRMNEMFNFLKLIDRNFRN